MQELKRRMTSAKAWGVEPVSLAHARRGEGARPLPRRDGDPRRVLLARRRRRRLAPRRHADARAGDRAGSPRPSPPTPRCSTSRPRAGGSRGVKTTEGDIETGVVVIACGVWSPRLARMAGACIPLTPAVHQMIDIGPVPRFEDAKRAIEFPIVRDMDTNMYERQDGTSLEIGSYAHRRDPVRPRGPALGRGGGALADRVPVHAGGLRAAARARARAHAGDRRRRERRHQVRDQRDPLPHARRDADPRRDARGEGAVVGGRRLGEGRPRRRQGARGVDGARRVRDRPPLLRRRALPRPPPDERAREGAHRRGLQQDLRHRPPARAVGVEPQRPAVAVPRARTRARRGLLRGGRLGAPAVVRVERAAARGVRRPGRAARGRVGLPLVVADHQRGAPRDARPGGLFDLSAFAIFDVLRPRRARRAAARLDAPGRRRGRPRRLHAVALAERRLQVRPHDHAARRRALPRRHRRRARHGGQEVAARPPRRRTARPSSPISRPRGARSASGARAPATSSRSVTSDDVSHEGFPFGTCRTIEIGPLRVLASRISYVGDLGWELYVPIEQGARLWDILWEAGRAHGAVPAGIGVYGTTGRLEKCYRAYGTELESEYTRRRGRDGARRR